MNNILRAPKNVLEGCSFNYDSTLVCIQKYYPAYLLTFTSVVWVGSYGRQDL